MIERESVTEFPNGGFTEKEWRIFKNVKASLYLGGLPCKHCTEVNRGQFGELEFSCPTAISTNTVEGVAFSILAALDGSALALPAFKVCPIVPPEDKVFNASNGVLNFPGGKDIGPLHEHFHLFDAKSQRYDPAAVNQARKYFQSMERAFRSPESR